MTFQKYLEHWPVSQEWSTWNDNKSFQEFYETCERGDWMARLFQLCNCHPYRANYQADIRLLTTVKIEQAKMCGINLNNAIGFTQGLMSEAELRKVGHRANAVASQYATETRYEGNYKISAEAKALILGKIAMPTTNAAEVAALVTIAIAGEDRYATSMHYALESAANTEKGKLILKQLADIVRENIPPQKFYRKF